MFVYVLFSLCFSCVCGGFRCSIFVTACSPSSDVRVCFWLLFFFVVPALKWEFVCCFCCFLFFCAAFVLRSTEVHLVFSWFVLLPLVVPAERLELCLLLLFSGLFMFCFSFVLVVCVGDFVVRFLSQPAVPARMWEFVFGCCFLRSPSSEVGVVVSVFCFCCFLFFCAAFVLRSTEFHIVFSWFVLLPLVVPADRLELCLLLLFSGLFMFCFSFVLVVCVGDFVVRFLSQPAVPARMWEFVFGCCFLRSPSSEVGVVVSVFCFCCFLFFCAAFVLRSTEFHIVFSWFVLQPLVVPAGKLELCLLLLVSCLCMFSFLCFVCSLLCFCACVFSLLDLCPGL